MSNTFKNGYPLRPSLFRPAQQVGTSQRRGASTMLARYGFAVAVVVLISLAAAAGIWPLAVPPSLPAQTTMEEFSTQRALVDLEVITAQPRAPGMPGLVDARDYLAAQFAALGLEPEIGDNIITRQSAELGVGILAQSHNIVARLPGTDSTGAIVIAGHLDSVHTTGGASDCGGCSVSVLEVARVLAAGAPLRNDVIFLVEDGEETTRAGALSFVEQHPWAADVRVALNQEAMGSGGASLLYVTGPENGRLLTESLKAMPAAVAYSFVNDLVWYTGTGGSDLDQLLMAAPVGLGLVYVGNVPAYHTKMDNVENLDPRTLQHRGDQLLAMARHFGNLPLDGTLVAPSLVYFTLVNGLTVRYSAQVGLGLALLAAVGYVLLVLAGLRRGHFNARGMGWGALLLLPLTLVASALSALLWYAIRLLDERLQVFLIGITYDQPWYTLAFVLLTAAFVVGGYALVKRQRWTDMGVGALAWWVLLSVLTAWRLPGSAPIFVLPSLLALLPLAWIAWKGEAQTGVVYRVLQLASAMGIVLVVAPALNFLGIFSGRAELIMGLPMIAFLPAPPAGLLAALLLPLWDVLWQVVSTPRRWPVPLAMASAAIVILVVVGATATFDESRPKPNMVAYVIEDGQAEWVTAAGNVGGRGALLDAWTSQFFPNGAQESTFNIWGAYYMGDAYAYPAYAGPAPLADFPAPVLEDVRREVGSNGQSEVQARLVFRQPSPMQILRVDADAGIVALQVNGKAMNEITGMEKPAQSLWVELYGLDTTVVDLTIAVAGEGKVRLWVEERYYSLPTLAEMEIAPRPATMMPSPTFVTDSSLVRTSFEVP